MEDCGKEDTSIKGFNFNTKSLIKKITASQIQEVKCNMTNIKLTFPKRKPNSNIKTKCLKVNVNPIFHNFNHA